MLAPITQMIVWNKSKCNEFIGYVPLVSGHVMANVHCYGSRLLNWWKKTVYKMIMWEQPNTIYYTRETAEEGGRNHVIATINCHSKSQSVDTSWKNDSMDVSSLLSGNWTLDWTCGLDSGLDSWIEVWTGHCSTAPQFRLISRMQTCTQGESGIFSHVSMTYSK